jgi:hypothetical protein
MLRLWFIKMWIMKRYKVKVSATYEVDADSPQEAVESVRETVLDNVDDMNCDVWQITPAGDKVVILGNDGEVLGMQG